MLFYVLKASLVAISCHLRFGLSPPLPLFSAVEVHLQALKSGKYTHDYEVKQVCSLIGVINKPHAVPLSPTKSFWRSGLPEVFPSLII